MTNTQIRSLIELLEHIRQRPAMYIDVAEPVRVDSFLQGVHVGLEVAEDHAIIAFSASPINEIKWRVIYERGWKWPTRGLVVYLSERGLLDTEIVDELLAIEIECWKRILQVQAAVEE